MGEINTRGMIRAKASSFPAGNDLECLSKAEVLNQGGGAVRIAGDYSISECPMIDDVIEIRPSVWFGYRHPDGTLQEVVDFSVNPQLTESMFALGNGGQLVFIVKGYPTFSNAKKIDKIDEKLVFDMWIKLPCGDGIGSCPIDNFIGKIDDYLCYIDFVFPANTLVEFMIEGAHRIKLTAKDASSNELESINLGFSVIG